MVKLYFLSLSYTHNKEYLQVQNSDFLLLFFLQKREPYAEPLHMQWCLKIEFNQDQEKKKHTTHHLKQNK